MAIPSDLDVNRRVRTVMIRHWIDLGRINFRSRMGVVTIRGSLDRIAGVTEPLAPPIVETIFAELRRIPDITRVMADLTNWTEESGTWKRIEGGHPRMGDSVGMGTTIHMTVREPTEGNTGNHP